MGRENEDVSEPEPTSPAGDLARIVGFAQGWQEMISFALFYAALLS
jgi:hypothetical protein